MCLAPKPRPDDTKISSSGRNTISSQEQHLALRLQHEALVGAVSSRGQSRKGGSKPKTYQPPMEPLADQSVELSPKNLEPVVPVPKGGVTGKGRVTGKEKLPKPRRVFVPSSVPQLTLRQRKLLEEEREAQQKKEEEEARIARAKASGPVKPIARGTLIKYTFQNVKGDWAWYSGVVWNSSGQNRGSDNWHTVMFEDGESLWVRLDAGSQHKSWMKAVARERKQLLEQFETRLKAANAPSWDKYQEWKNSQKDSVEVAASTRNYGQGRPKTGLVRKAKGVGSKPPAAAKARSTSKPGPQRKQEVSDSTKIFI